LDNINFHRIVASNIINIIFCAELLGDNRDFINESLKMHPNNSKRAFLITSGIVFTLLLLGEGIYPQNLALTQKNRMDNSSTGINTIQNKITEKSPTSEFENPETASSGLMGYNDTFYGQGVQLNYTIQADGQGNRTNVETVDTGGLLTLNQTSMNIVLPENALAKNVTLSLTDLEKRNDQELIGNDSLEYYPGYWIIYTTLVNNTNLDPLAINITINNTDSIPLTKVRILYNGTFNAEYVESAQDIIQFNHTSAIDINTTINATVEFYWYNGTLFQSENFLIRANTNYPTQYDYSTIQVQEISNPKFRMNLANNPYIAIKFTMPKTANFTSFSLYGQYNLLSLLLQEQYHVQITIWKEFLNQPFTNTGFKGLLPNNGIYIQPITGWQEFYLNSYGGVNLEAGNYYLIINATGIPTGTQFPYYFDIYGTTNYTQYNTLYSLTGMGFVQLQTNILFKYSFQDYEPTALSVDTITVHTSILNQTQDFNSTQSTLKFLFSSPLTPTGTILINFNSTWAVRFNITYTVMINQTLVSDSSNFTLKYPGTLIEWNNTLHAEQPNDIANHTWYHTWNYSVYFPARWSNFNGTAPSHFIQSNQPQLDINKTVAPLPWTFKANSIGQSMILNTTDGRTQYAQTMNITALGIFNSTFANATLTYWDANYTSQGSIQTANYLENSTSFRTVVSATSPSQTVFDSFYIPLNFNNSVLTARIWWNNNTDAGIVFKNFSIIQYAELVVFNQSVFLETNSSTTIQFEYRDLAEEPIIDANITTNWTENNWTARFDNTTNRYYLEFRSYNMSAGDVFDVLVNFTHPSYVSQWATIRITIYNFVNTSLLLVSGNPQVYLGQDFTLKFSWLRWDGTPVDMTNTTCQVRLDDQIVPNERLKITLSQTDVNIQIDLFTRYYFGQNFVGNHRLFMNISQETNDAVYQSQSYTYYFQLNPIPTRLSLNDTTGMQTDTTTIEHYENNPLGLRISVFLTANDTSTNPIQPATPYASGTVFGMIFDRTRNETVAGISNFTNHRTENKQGYYSIIFQTNHLITTHDYEIRIWANTTNFIYQEIRINLILLAQVETQIIYEGFQIETENKQLEITGKVWFSNGSAQWPAANIILNVTIFFRGYTTNYTQSFLIQTNANGEFRDTSIKVENSNKFDYMNVTITYSGDIASKAQQYSVRVQIQEDWIVRYLIPIVLTILGILIAVPLFAKYGWPFLVKKFPTFKLVQKMQASPIIKRILDIKDEIPIDPIDQIKELKVPITQMVEDSVSGVDNKENVEFDVIEVKSTELDSNNEVVPKPLTVFGTKIQRPKDTLRIPKKTPMMKKEMHWNEGAKFERQGDYLNAILNYMHAHDDCKLLNATEELGLIDKKIKMLSMELPPKEQMKILKIRQKMGII
jgi:hypothetical protein